MEKYEKKMGQLDAAGVLPRKVHSLRVVVLILSLSLQLETSGLMLLPLSKRAYSKISNLVVKVNLYKKEPLK